MRGSQPSQTKLTKITFSNSSTNASVRRNDFVSNKNLLLQNLEYKSVMNDYSLKKTEEQLQEIQVP